jgi:hypothetical protein
MMGCGEDTGSTGRVTDTDNVMGAKYKVGDSVDLNNDGTPDGVAVDSNGDGTADSVDTNADGKGDQPLPGASAGGGGNGGSGGNGTAANGGSTPGNGSGTNASAGGNGDNEDAGMSGGGPSDCEDDPDTYGNDCPGVVSCSNSIAECSLETQNCCVSAYAEDATSCNEGSQCDGLASAACDGPEDCSGGQLCCISVSVGLGGADIDSRCVPDAGACKGGLITNSLLCHTDDTCPADKPSCEPIGNLPWWGICK